MNHLKNAIEIVADAPITAEDFADCYTNLSRVDCYFLLQLLTSAGILHFNNGIYAI